MEKQTEVTLACDFSGDVSDFFEGHRRIYALRSEAFARAFAAANRDRFWTAEDDARSARRRNVVFLAVVGAAVVGWLAVKLLG